MSERCECEHCPAASQCAEYQSAVKFLEQVKAIEKHPRVKVQVTVHIFDCALQEGGLVQ